MKNNIFFDTGKKFYFLLLESWTEIRISTLFHKIRMHNWLAREGVKAGASPIPCPFFDLKKKQIEKNQSKFDTDVMSDS